MSGFSNSQKWWISAVLIALLAPMARAAEPNNLDGQVSLKLPQLESLRAEFIALVDQDELASLSLGVAKDGVIVWAESFGYADRESGRPATPDTPYLLASTSKSVAATALMTLVSTGKISLDDPVNDLIKPLALTGYGGLDANRVKVQDLVHCTAGVPHGWFSATDTQDLPTREALLKWSGMVVFPPGTTWEYSNFSLGLTEIVVQQTTSTSFDDYLAGALFDPLGMNDAASEYNDTMSERAAVRYSPSLERLESRGGAIPAAGLGMFASVNDLLAFGMFHLDPGDAGPVTDEMLSLMHEYPGQSSIYGLGWYRMNDTLTSNGSAAGANSHLSIHPGERLVIVALTNTTSRKAIADTIVGKIKDRLVAPLPADRRFRYETYAAIYENDYLPSPDFIGRWEGYVKAPSLAETPATLSFHDDGTVTLEIQSIGVFDLEKLVFNTKNRFKGRSSGRFPPLFSVDQGEYAHVSLRVNLHKAGDRLTGEINVQRSGDSYNYSVGVFAQFGKMK